MCDIQDLHNTLSQSSYDQLLASTISKWQKDADLSNFVDYFQRQWTNSKFCNWQLIRQLRVTTIRSKNLSLNE
jgi:hypothetical protein